jgi:hypothetical protein
LSNGLLLLKRQLEEYEYDIIWQLKKIFFFGSYFFSNLCPKVFF